MTSVMMEDQRLKIAMKVTCVQALEDRGKKKDKLMKLMKIKDKGNVCKLMKIKRESNNSTRMRSEGTRGENGNLIRKKQIHQI